MCNYYVRSIPALRVLSHFFLHPSLSYLAMVLGLSGSTQSIHVYIEYYRNLVKERPWAGAPYKSAKEVGGQSFECFRILSQKSTHVMFTTT